MLQITCGTIWALSQSSARQLWNFTSSVTHEHQINKQRIRDAVGLQQFYTQVSYYQKESQARDNTGWERQWQDTIMEKILTQMTVDFDTIAHTTKRRIKNDLNLSKSVDSMPSWITASLQALHFPTEVLDTFFSIMTHRLSDTWSSSTVSRVRFMEARARWLTRRTRTSSSSLSHAL